MRTLDSIMTVIGTKLEEKVKELLVYCNKPHFSQTRSIEPNSIIPLGVGIHTMDLSRTENPS
jgi:hypothetical protein